MTHITKEEVVRVARMSHIEFNEQEIEKMQIHLEAVLSYAARVQDIAKEVDQPQRKNRNVEREDKVIRCDSEAIRVQAPEREGDYFVVPVIIETTE